MMIGQAGCQTGSVALVEALNQCRYLMIECQTDPVALVAPGNNRKRIFVALRRFSRSAARPLGS